MVLEVYVGPMLGKIPSDTLHSPKIAEVLAEERNLVIFGWDILADQYWVSFQLLRELALPHGIPRHFGTA